MGMYKGVLLDPSISPVYQMREIDRMQSKDNQGSSQPAGGGSMSLGQLSMGGALGGTTATSPAPVGVPSAGGGATGGVGGTTLDQLTNIADPWSSQRGQYQTQLSDLMKNPSSFLQSPTFKASSDAGIDAVNRSAAAKGMLGSGNRLQALMDYGQKNASDQFYKMSDLLSGLGGAKNQNPGGGLSAFGNLQNANTAAYNAETGRMSQQAGVNQFNAGQQADTDRVNQLLKWQQDQQDAQRRKDTLPSYMW